MTLAKAEVVAANVEVEERVAGEVAGRRSLTQPRQRPLQPVSADKTAGEERLRVARDELPAVQALAQFFQGRQTRRRSGRGDVAERCEHLLDLARLPGRRPVGG